MNRDFAGFAVEVNDFKKLLDEKGFYVDKTLFIKEVLDDNSDALLISRPRRFDKA